MDTRMKELRLEKGLTLKQLGKILNVRDNTLSQYETGKRNPQFGFLKEFANFFDISLDYLLKNTDKRDIPLESDQDFINLLEQLKKHFNYFDKMTLFTQAQLAIWISKNRERFTNGDLKKYVRIANNFLSNFSVETKGLSAYSDIRKKNFKIIEKIDDELLNEEENTATPNQVLEFIEQSKRISVDDIDKTLNFMKELPDWSDDQS